MPVSEGNLDSLVGLVLPYTDWTGLTTQTIVGTPDGIALGSGKVTSVTGTDTGAVGQGVSPLNQIEILGVNDTTNSVNIGLLIQGSTTPVTTESWYVLGVNAQGVLMSGNTQSVIATLDISNPSGFDVDNAVLAAAPIAAGTSLTFTPNGSYAGFAGNATPTPTPSPAPTPTPSPLPTPTPTPITGLTVADVTTHQPVSVAPEQYDGPVAGIQDEFIDVTADNLNVTVSTPNWFLHSGSGTDALAVSSGTNVLDGGTGSNFLTGGSGADTFFVDDRSAPTDIWSTVNNFHAGDAATIFGVTPDSFTLSWVDGQGAIGFSGLTLHATAAGKPTASLTLVGFSSADLSNGKLTVSYGTTAASGSTPGSTYMYVHAN